MIRSVVIAMSVLAAVGCSDKTDTLLNGESVSTAKLPMSTIEISLNSGYVRKTLQLDVSTSLRGTDTDSNGVRDDVDEFIDESYETRFQRHTAWNFALVLQAAMNPKNSSPTYAKQISLMSSRAEMCIYAAFDGAKGSKQPKQVVKELREITTNTKNRLQAYVAYTKSLDSTSGDLPKGDKCEIPEELRMPDVAPAPTGRTGS